MKKFFAITCALIFVMCMSLTAFAAPSLPAIGTNDDAEIDTSNNEVETPVYGYVGPDALITDPVPTDPGTEPDVDPVATDMEISLPVKLMWAAFASDGGAVTSPTYTIENKSAFAVDVELTSFDQTNTVRNATKDAQISLNLVGLGESWGTASNVVGMTVPVNAGTLTASGATASKTFTIGGTYGGSFADPYQPTYNMVLTFSIA